MTSWPSIAVIGAGAVTAFAWRTAWPDLIVGLAIFAINLDAAREVFAAAKEEHAEAGRP
jgi:Co/Zn/Cd efflux system component